LAKSSTPKARTTKARKPAAQPTAAATATGLLPAGAAEALLEGTHGDPFAVLGPHLRETHGQQVLTIAALAPEASTVRVIETGGSGVWDLAVEHPGGVFTLAIPERSAPFAYKLEITRHGQTWQQEDACRFGSTLPEKPFLRFRQGHAWRPWELFGAHPHEADGVAGYRFAVWAPHARRVSVVGPFNGWDGRLHVMRKRHEAGIWEIFVPGLVAGEIYKFELLGPDGALLPLKADPYAFHAEVRPNTASRLAPSPATETGDAGWMADRGGRNSIGAPVSIYEIHAGSWRTVPEEANRPLTYDELGDWLIPYVRDLGFTHVQFMPLTEHPYDGSWGYQTLGLFAATSRFGTPDQFRLLVSRLHQAGIGVLCDFVPAHFPTDAHGLALFDGTHLYEHEDPRLGWHPDWKTNIYNFARPEVVNFLIASALFWLERFGIDGLRVDAVSSMLYLDYSRQPGEWVPNVFGGNTNLEAVSFMQRMNEMAYGENPGIMMVAEESTAWPGVSKASHDGGLGFGYKWNLGWMHDTLSYMSKDPIHRSWHHGDITFGLAYAFSENFILALSHDEVVHGKGSLLAKMGGGDDWQKFASLRAYYSLMWAHPGKKLLFMGGEFGQRAEWNHNTSLDWHELEAPAHRGIHNLVRDLNRLYRELPALHRKDCEASGFQWLQASNSAESVFAWARHADGEPPVVAVFNMTPMVRDGYRVPVPHGGRWRVVLNSDSSHYGGANVDIGQYFEADGGPHDGQAESIVLTLPPMAGVWLVPG
jgi:1,4-alpha-glucan branching enzyme